MRSFSNHDVSRSLYFVILMFRINMVVSIAYNHHSKSGAVNGVLESFPYDTDVDRARYVDQDTDFDHDINFDLDIDPDHDTHVDHSTALSTHFEKIWSNQASNAIVTLNKFEFYNLFHQKALSLKNRGVELTRNSENLLAITVNFRTMLIGTTGNTGKDRHYLCLDNNLQNVVVREKIERPHCLWIRVQELEYDRLKSFAYRGAKDIGCLAFNSEAKVIDFTRPTCAHVGAKFIIYRGRTEV